MSQTNKIAISALVVIILLGIYIAYDRNSKTGLGNASLATTTLSNVNSTSSSVALASSSKTAKTGTLNSSQYTIEQVPAVSKPKVTAPSLDRPVTFLASLNLSTEAKASIAGKINEIQETLRKNPTDLSSWLDLGIYQKMAGDYQGSLLSWGYVGAVASKDYVSFANIANLYAYYLHDNGLAEINFRKAITNGPTHSYLYIQTAEMYRDVFQDMSKARAVIEEGLKAIPNDPALLEFKANLK